MKLVQLSGLDEFISKIPGGYDLQLLDGGKGLSGGPKTNRKYDKSYCYKYHIFILDEPTSAMDMNAENLFLLIKWENFKRLSNANRNSQNASFKSCRSNHRYE